MTADPTPRDVGPSRPAAVELAAAILIVGGVISLIGAVGGASALPGGTLALVLATIALDVASIAVGLLIRAGRAWIVDVNYVAIIGFLDLTAAGSSPIAEILGLADAAVVVILLVHRPWFQQRAASAAGRTVEEPDRP